MFTDTVGRSYEQEQKVAAINQRCASVGSEVSTFAKNSSELTSQTAALLSAYCNSITFTIVV
jgi:hypothetical protein